MTFPNVLVLNYLKQTKQTSPEVQLRAENFIGLGYQRLLTFEVKGGGFSLYGQPPASIMLSAKGLLEISDMSKVYPVDSALIDRTRNWLIAQQKPDGTWAAVTNWDSTPAGYDPLPLTAYVAWTLLESGVKDNAGVNRAISYIRENSLRATDPYVQALVANALVAADPNASITKDMLARLDQSRQTQADVSYWSSKVGSFTGAYGISGDIETTALATYAFLKARTNPEAAQKGLTYLIQKKSPNGTWGSTQATILALRALVESVWATGETTSDATVRVSFNDAQAKPINITKENSGVVQIVTFDDVKPGNNRITFNVDGKGSFAYQITASYYLPWEYVPPTPEKDKLVDIQVAYDRTTLAVNDQVGVKATIRLTKEGKARMTIVDLGVPPGFSVASEGLEAAVKNKTIARYELTGRQIILYLEEFDSKKPITLSYHLTAKFPVRAKSPASTTYDYYNPGTSGLQAPTTLTVR